MIKNKRGGLTDLFLFLIITFVIVLFCGVFIYITNETTDQLHETMDKMDIGDGIHNASETIDNTIGKATTSFDALYWISVFLIFGMIVGIFIGSYMVTTKPIFFIPYLFIVIIAVIVAVPISNAYEILRSDATLSSTFNNFIGANYILNYLPMIVVIIGLVGGIIMFSQMGKREQYGGVYG